MRERLGHPFGTRHSEGGRGVEGTQYAKGRYGIEIRTILSPDITQLVKFAGSDNSQFVDLQDRTFLSYLLCRVGQFKLI